MRFLPHLQDTGGFFITVIRKNKEIEVQPTEATPAGTEAVVAEAPAENEEKKESGDGESKQHIFLFVNAEKERRRAVEGILRNFRKIRSFLFPKKCWVLMILSRNTTVWKAKRRMFVILYLEMLILI